MSTKKQKIYDFFSIAILVFLLVYGLNNPSNIDKEQSSQAAPAIELTVSAAASLKNVMVEIEPLFEEKYPNVDIVYNFASSGSLQRQIEQGAPADIFISAASKQMDALEKQGVLLPLSRRNLLWNEIVLVVPQKQTKNNLKDESQVNNFSDLTTKAVQNIALGEPNSVPIGKYAQEVLNSFQIAEPVNAKAVYGKDVRQVLNYVATGNVDAAIVYRTDAQITDQVRIVAIAPESSHSAVTYPIAVVNSSEQKETATQLIEFLSSPEVQVVFEDYGFISISGR